MTRRYWETRRKHQRFQSEADVAKPVDARDLKSLGRKAVRVRPPPSAPAYRTASKGLAIRRPEVRLIPALEKGLGAIGGLAIAILTDITISDVLRANKRRLPRAI